MTETASRAKLRAVDRRTVLKVGGATAAALALPMPWLFRPRGKLPPSLRADPRGILDLPPGFSYRVLSRAGDAMSDGYRVPALADGMACFTGPKGTLVLMRNHEIGHVPDPAAATGSEAEVRLAFSEAYRMLNNRISVFVSLPLASLDRLALQRHLDAIGKRSD